jgi:predicted DNA-binding WGR domain protein
MKRETHEAVVIPGEIKLISESRYYYMYLEKRGSGVRLIRHWGSRYNSRHGMKTEYMSIDDGKVKWTRIIKTRKRHGYKETDHLNIARQLELEMVI